MTDTPTHAPSLAYAGTWYGSIVHATEEAGGFKEKVIRHRCTCGKVLEIRIREVDE